MAHSQESRGPGKNKKNWTTEQDEKLVELLLEFTNEGLYHADTGFKNNALKEMEARLESKLPGCGIKGKPHIESRMKTLKTKWSAVRDLLSGQNTSGFGWDPEKKCVTAEKEVWNAYALAHPKAASMQNKSFPYFEDLCIVWGKDRANGRDAETPADVVEELEKEDAGNEDDHMTNEENIGVGLDEIPTSMSFTEGPSEGSSKANKKRKSGGFDDFFVEAMDRASKLVAEKMEHSSSVLSKAIGLDITEKQMMIHGELEKLVGFTRLEKHKAGCMIGADTYKTNIFFSLPDDNEKEDWVRALLNGEI